VINRQGRAYAGPLSDAEVARTLADACGHWGSGADYLYNVVSNLERYGMHDSHLWRLQQLVAENIQAKS
jgi:cation transport protein ChaC